MRNFKNIKGISAIGFADTFGASISAFFWFYLATLIHPNEYGELSYILGTVGLLSAFTLFGTQNTIIVYLSKKIQIESTFFFISITTGTILAIFTWFISSKLAPSFLILAFIIYILSLGDLLGRKKFSQYGIYVILQKTTSCILGISFYYMYGTEGILYGIALSYTFFIFRIVSGFKDSRIDFSILRKNLAFTTYNYMAMLLITSKSQVDKILIAAISNLDLLGNYSLALQVFSVFMLLPGIVFRYLIPNDASGIKNTKLKFYTIIVSVVLTSVGIILAPEIIPLFFPKFTDLMLAIRILSLAIIPSTVNLILFSKFLGHGSSKPLLIIKAISLSSYIVFMLIMEPTFGLIGIALSFLFSTICETISMLYFQKFLKPI